MCGGLIAASAKTPVQVARYHLGRLAGYVALGAAAGLLGERAFREASYGQSSFWMVPWVATGFLALGLILSGLRIWTGKGMHLQILPAVFLQRLYSKNRGSALRTGLLSAFLPCGWLHTFVLASLATRNAWLGAILLFAFWLGTLPALTAAPILLQKIFRPLSQRLPKLSASVLILAGIACIGVKVKPLVDAASNKGEQPVMTCHSPMHH
jgi:hypothetical protein